MKKSAIICGLFILCLRQVAYAGPLLELKSKSDLISYIKDGSFNGVVLVQENHSILMKEAFGVKDISTQEPLTTNDKFHIGSNTKQFVAASLLKLQELGLINIDDSVSKYLSQFLAYPQITIRNLLNHTSGIANYTDMPEFEKMISFEKILTLDEIIEFSLKYPLDFETGSQWKYSNTGFIVAGKIIELVTKQSWDQFITQNFLLPMQMNQSGYDPYFKNVSPVKAHYRDAGELKKYDEFNLSWALSAGAIYSTVDDMTKWLEIYRGQTNLISGESLKDMTTAFKANYGLGVMVKKIGSETLIWHTGRTPGFVSFSGIVKERDLKVVTLDNSDGALGGLGDLLVRFYMNGKATALKVKEVNVTIEKLNEYVGDFHSDGMDVSVFLKDGNLFLQPNDGQPPYYLKAVDEDSFNLEGFAGEEFIRDTTGKVVGLKHYQNGGVTNFNKIERNSLLKRLKIKNKFFASLKSNYKKLK